MAENKVLVVGNWKMNHGGSSATELIHAYRDLSQNLQRTELWATPPATVLLSCVGETKGAPTKVGAQNVHWGESGAFTGELSPTSLQEIGCEFCLVGHSERRTLFGDTNESVAKRLRGGLRAGLQVILCIGEGLDDRTAGKTHQTLREQLRTALFEEGEGRTPVESSLLSSLTIAYEPVWAIGTGKVASSEEIDDAHNFIKAFLKERKVEIAVPVLYGGSVKPSNFAEVLAVPAVDGALVGGASIVPDQVSALCAIAEERG